MPERKKKKPAYREWTEEELKAVYAQARKDFTAADLQKYTVDEPMVPLEKVIKDMKAIQRGFNKKKGK